MCETELFVERAVQDAKSSRKCRAHAFPEPTIAKFFLLKNQVLAQRVEWADRFPALVAPAGQHAQLSRETSSHSLNVPDDAFSSHMLGAGKAPDGAQLEVWKRAAQ